MLAYQYLIVKVNKNERKKEKQWINVFKNRFIQETRRNKFLNKSQKFNTHFFFIITF